MVGLAREVGGGVVVDPILLEAVVPEVAPEHGAHAQLVGHREGLGHLDDLPTGLGGAEVDRGAHRARAHVLGLLDGAEHDLVELVGQREQLVVVDLHDEGNAVGVAARAHAEHTEGAGHGVAAAFDGQLHDVLRIEVVGVLGEAGPGAVLDALIDREDAHVAGAAEAPVVEDALKRADHAGGAVAVEEDALGEVGAGEGETLAGNAAAGVTEEALGVLAEQCGDLAQVHGSSEGEGGAGSNPRARTVGSSGGAPCARACG